MPTPGTIAIIILVVLILAVVVSCIQIVQQSKAYVIERLGAFHSVWGVGMHFKLPFAKVTPWVVLAFLALVVVLMCFSASYRVAVIAGVIWLAILFAAYQITQAKK